MGRGKDPFWDYGTDLGGSRFRCNFCQKTFVGTITRLKYHLSKIVGRDVLPCTAVPENVWKKAEACMTEHQNKKMRTSTHCASASSSVQSAGGVIGSSSGPSGGEQHRHGMEGLTQTTLFSSMKKKEKEALDLELVEVMVDRNLPFNLLRSDKFKALLGHISSFGPGYIPPSCDTARTRILATLKGQADEYIKTCRTSWSKWGCTIMSDCWTDGRKRPHINLLVASPSGTVFWKSECTTGRKKDAAYISEFICKGIEEIGPDNVVQFVSDNASNYTSAGRDIMEKYPHIYKTSCAAHCLDLILEDIDKLDFVKPIITSARDTVKFFYKYQHVLDLMRKFTEGRELKRPGATRFATEFLCLQSILREEQALRYTIASAEWRALPQSKTEEGLEIGNAIQGNAFWESGKEIIRVVEPLVRVLRMADGDGSTLGYIYEAMDRAKETIKEVLEDKIERYAPIWNIIDRRWDGTLHSPIHAAAAYFNPQLWYEDKVKFDNEIKKGLRSISTKMITSESDRKSFNTELKVYHQKDPRIFDQMAIDNLENSHPRIWWDMWGTDVPVLQRLAIRLHSQPCSASACERNWSAFEAAHTKKRNRLEPKKLHDLVFIRMNMHLKDTSAKVELKDSEPIRIDMIKAFPNLDDASVQLPVESEEEDEEDSTGESDEEHDDIDELDCINALTAASGDGDGDGDGENH